MQTLSTRFQLLPLDAQLKETLLAALLPLAEAWSGVKLVGVDKDIYRYIDISLLSTVRVQVGTSVYGVRRYGNGSWLAAHVDQLHSHVVRWAGDT